MYWDVFWKSTLSHGIRILFILMSSHFPINFSMTSIFYNKVVPLFGLWNWGVCVSGLRFRARGCYWTYKDTSPIHPFLHWSFLFSYSCPKRNPGTTSNTSKENPKQLLCCFNSILPSYYLYDKCFLKRKVFTTFRFTSKTIFSDLCNFYFLL